MVYEYWFFHRYQEFSKGIWKYWKNLKYCVGTQSSLRSILRIWSHLLKKSLMENFIFCLVCVTMNPLQYFAIILSDI